MLSRLPPMSQRVGIPSNIFAGVILWRWCLIHVSLAGAGLGFGGGVGTPWRLVAVWKPEHQETGALPTTVALGKALGVCRG